MTEKDDEARAEAAEPNPPLTDDKPAAAIHRLSYRALLLGRLLALSLAANLVLVLVLGGGYLLYRSQRTAIANQGKFATSQDCDRQLRIKYQKLSDQITAAFNATASNPDLNARISDPALIALSKQREAVTVAQQHVRFGQPCPKPKVPGGRG